MQVKNSSHRGQACQHRQHQGVQSASKRAIPSLPLCPRSSSGQDALPHPCAPVTLRPVSGHPPHRAFPFGRGAEDQKEAVHLSTWLCTFPRRGLTTCGKKSCTRLPGPCFLPGGLTDPVSERPPFCSTVNHRGPRRPDHTQKSMGRTEAWRPVFDVHPQLVSTRITAWGGAVFKGFKELR